MPSRFGTYPVFATGKKVVLDDDNRLGGCASYVPANTTTTVPVNHQHAAFVPIRIDGTLIIDGTLVMF